MRIPFASCCVTTLTAWLFVGSTVAFAIGTPEAIVCDHSSNNVSIFDRTATSPQIITVNVDNYPSNVAITPDGSQAWACNSANVSVINLDTNDVLGTVNVGSSPNDIAITPDGSQAWVCSSNSTVSVIDVGTRIIIGNPIGVGSDPEGIAITPDGTQAWVCNFADDTISIISVGSLRVVSTISYTSPRSPFRIAMRPDIPEAWVTNSNEGTVSVFRLSSQKEIDTIPVGKEPKGIAFTPDGTRVWVCNFNSDTLSVINADKKNVVDTISVDHGIAPEGIAIAPDGKSVLETNYYGCTVGVIDQGSPRQNARTIQLGSKTGPMGIALAPDQAPIARFVMASGGNNVFFDASDSSSTYGTIAKYTWNFGDGSQEIVGTDRQISHIFAANGIYSVTLTVTNTQGTSITQTFTGKTVSNNGGPSAQVSQQLVVTGNFVPSIFRGTSKIHRKAKKLVLKTTWSKSSSSKVARYRIFAHRKKIASIRASHPRKYTLRLHPQHFPKKHLSENYKQYLMKKYSICAVKANGKVSTSTPLQVFQ